MIDRLGEDARGARGLVHAPERRASRQAHAINRKYPLAELLAACGRYSNVRRATSLPRVRHASKGETSRGARTPAHRAGSPVPCKINLIPFNPFPNSGFVRSPRRAIERSARCSRGRLVVDHAPGRAGTKSTPRAGTGRKRSTTVRGGRHASKDGLLKRLARAADWLRLPAVLFVCAGGPLSGDLPGQNEAGPSSGGGRRRERARIHHRVAGSYYQRRKPRRGARESAPSVAAGLLLCARLCPCWASSTETCAKGPGGGRRSSVPSG